MSDLTMVTKHSERMFGVQLELTPSVMVLNNLRDTDSQAMRGDFALHIRLHRRVGAILLCIVIWAVFVLLGMANEVFAQNKPALDDPEGKPVDAVLLLDSSASMRLTDPERLRDEGAKLFTQFLKSGDKLGIVEFDSEARVLRPLTEYHPMQVPDIEKAVSSSSDTGIYTDPVSGVLEAKKMLEKDLRPNALKTIILLSDGKLDPDPKWATPEGLREGLIYRLLPELKQKGIVLHTLALSKEADKELLAQMAQATDGMSWYSETPEGIHEAFADLFLVVKKPQIVPMSSKGFRIDGEVEQATFYINTENQDNAILSVKTPSGNVYDPDNLGSGMRWYAGTRFHAITVDDPEVGVWQVLGLPDNKGFATVLTELKLITDWPSSMLAGNKRVLRARLYDQERPVVLPAMTNETTYAFQITPTDRVSEPIIRELLRDDGVDADSVADDGVFSANVELDTPGDYQLKLLAKGPTFERQQTIPFRVKPRLINLTVVPVEQIADVTLGHTGGTTIDYFRVTLNPEVAGLKNIEIKLIAIDSKKRLLELPIKKRSDGSLRYEVSSTELAQEGEYELQATIKGETRKKTVQGVSQVVSYEKKKTEIDSAPQVEYVVVKEEPEVQENPYLLFSLIIFLANAGTAAFCFLKLKKSGAPAEEDLPSFEADPAIAEAIAALEATVQATEVDLDDPRYQEGHDIDIPLPSSATGGGDEADLPDDIEPERDGDEGNSEEEDDGTDPSESDDSDEEEEDEV
ncbi:MAG: VWA domain-containing protein [Bdellovibrionales bacterium]|nr:VWA domain-containing protein [Bdellovibrionales bacterium]